MSDSTSLYLDDATEAPPAPTLDAETVAMIRRWLEVEDQWGELEDDRDAYDERIEARIEPLRNEAVELRESVPARLQALGLVENLDEITILIALGGSPRAVHVSRAGGGELRAHPIDLMMVREGGSR